MTAPEKTQGGRCDTLRERDLYAPVRDWLASRGYTIHVEVFEADVVAVKDGLITAIELKTSQTDGLCVQVNRRCQWADYVYAAVPSNRIRATSQFKGHGIGLLAVDPTSGSVRERLKPKPQPWWWRKRHDYRAKKLATRAPAMAHECAGLPCTPELKANRLKRLDQATRADAAERREK